MFEGIVHVSCHDELPTGMLVKSEIVEDYEYDPQYKWMVVQLANGFNRDVLVKDVKQL